MAFTVKDINPESQSVEGVLSFYASETAYFWVHFGLVILGFLVALATLIGQWIKPAPYGKHERSDPNWGPMVPQRLGHMTSDGLTGVVMFSLVFFLYSREESDKGPVNYIFFSLFLVHSIHRGLIHPMVMRYRNPKVALGIVLGGMVPNILYTWLNANHLGVAGYDLSYYYDPRFLLGLLLFVSGFFINRWSDWKLRSLRQTKGCHGYYIPYGGLFDLISCPNYFGELVQWTGWTLGTWSLAGLVWLCFSAATFLARSRHNHQWYKEQFEDYPANRKALIPYIF